MANAVNKRVNIYINGVEVENNIKGVRAEMAKLVNEQNKMTIGSDEYVAHSKKIQSLNSILQQHREANRFVNKELENTKNLWASTLVKWAAGTVLIKNVSDLYTNLKSKIQELSEEFARYDDTLSSTEKYTGLTRKQVLELTEDLKKIDTRTSIENLQKLAQEAGKLGITGRQDILDFVDAANTINIALGEDLGEDAVLNIGKLAMMFGDDQKYGLKQAMLNTASAINQVAQSSSASEPYLMDFMARLSGTGKQAGLTQAQIIGLGSAMDQNMQELEVSTSAISQLLIKMYQDPSKFAAIAGLDVKEFARLMKEDANEGFLTLINTLSKKGGLSELAPIFKEMNLDGVRASQIISVLAGNIDNIRQQQENANKAYSEGTSVINEYNRMNENQAAALEKAKNAAALKRAELGEKLIPILTLMTKAESSLFNILGKLAKVLYENKGIVTALAILWAGYGIKLMYANISTKALALSTKILNGLQAIQAVVVESVKAKYYQLTGQTLLAARAQEALSIATKSVPWMAIASAIIIAVGALIKYKNKQSELEKSVTEFNKQVAKENFQAKELFDRLNKLKSGTEEFNKVQKQIINTYPDILQNQLDEKGNLIDLKAAYDAVTKSIESKKAAQLQEDAVGNVIENYISDIQKNLNAFDISIRRQIRTLAEEGKSAVDIIKEINASTNMNIPITVTQKTVVDVFSGKTYEKEVNSKELEIIDKIVERAKRYNRNLKEIKDKFSPYIQDEDLVQLKTIEKTIESLNEKLKKSTDDKEKAAIEAQIKAYKEKAKAVKEGKEVETDTKTPPADPKGWEAFYKKVEDLRKSFKKKELDGYAKEKEDITQRYDELIEEAKKFGVKGTTIAKELEIEKGKAIVTAGEKYLDKYNDVIKKINEETAKISKKTDFSTEQSAFVNELLGSESEWNDHINAIAVHINSLSDLLKDSTPEEAANIQKKLDELTNSYVNAVQGKTQATLDIIKKYANDSADFVIDSEERVTDATLNEQDKRIKEITKKYDDQIKIATETLEKLKKINEQKPSAENEAEIKRLEGIIKKLQELKGTEIDLTLKLNMDSKSIWEQILSKDFWKGFKDNFRDSLAVLADAVSEISSSILTIFDDINQYQQQVGEYELDQYNKIQDKKLDSLQKQLDSGAISQDAYNKRVEQINKESAEKESAFKRKQFEKERKAKIAQVLIEGGLAVAKAFSQYGWPWGLIPAGLSTIQTGVQTGLIAAQPNPYRKGGYIPYLMNIVAGEEGPEWMANNKTLNDPKTAGIIEELDKFQKGRKSIFDGASVDNQSMSQMFAKNGSIFTSTKSNPAQEINNYYTTDTDKLDVMTKELKQLNQYMSDPNNRKAVISRDIQTEFDKKESFLRNLARS